MRFDVENLVAKIRKKARLCFNENQEKSLFI